MDERQTDQQTAFAVHDFRDQIVQELLEAGWLRDCRWLDEVDSTSSLLMRELRQAHPPPLPALRIADRQTAGRGRSDKRWFSPTGCLMCTLAIGRDQLPADAHQLQQLALIAGIAVARTAERFVDPAVVRLKWPNDLYVDERKCGGILIESVFDGRDREKTPGAAATMTPQPSAWLIGIGINVAIQWREAPEEIRQSATCLQSKAARPLTTGEVLMDLVDHLQQTLTAWRSGDLDWAYQWQSRCLLTGRSLTAKLPGGQTLSGRCVGIDALGRLQIHSAGGLHSLQSAEIIAWSPML